MKKRVVLFAVVMFLMFIPISCTTNYDVVFLGKNPGPYCRIQLGEITYDGEMPYNNLELVTQEMQMSAASNAGFLLDNSAENNQNYTVDIFYRDVEILKGFRRLHSVSVFLTLKNSSNMPIVKVFLSQDGESSIKSMAVYWNLTKKAWNALYEGLNNNE